MTANRQIDYDAIVVGARCAGAATAMLLARQGLRVLAVERSRYGSDTLSTHALMRTAVMQLHKWGVLEQVQAAGTPPVRSTSFHYGDEVVTVPIKPKGGLDALYAPRRALLDSLLVDAARRSGAEVRHGARMVDLLRGADGRVRGAVIEDGNDPDGGTREVRADLVVGADGINSTVAKLVGAEPYRVARHASAVVYGYWRLPEGDGGYHFHYRPGTSSGAIPTNGGETCVFASVPPQRFKADMKGDLAGGYRRALEECNPELAASLDSGSLQGHLRGFAGVPGYFRQSVGPGWALVGDAGYFKDPLTAHGISDALRDAELLSRAAAGGSDRRLAAYQTERDALSLGFFEATDAIASFEWSLPEVHQLHLAASEEMQREFTYLSQLDQEDAAAAA